MQLVVVIAVRNAVSAATTTFTAISMKRFFIIVNFQLSIVNYPLGFAACYRRDARIINWRSLSSGPCRHRRHWTW